MIPAKTARAGKIEDPNGLLRHQRDTVSQLIDPPPDEIGSFDHALNWKAI
jgi:hypothetical protein